MSRIATLLFICILTAVLSPAPRVEASSHPPASVDILVNGVPLHRYAHRGRWYVEALKGREYAIQLRNPYGVRVGIALSVDGLNTIDAQQTSASDARKWILEPYLTVVISGWQTSRTVARRFEFTTEESSYAQALGKGSNLGLISAVYFKERPRPILTEQRRDDERAAPGPAALPAPAAVPSKSQERSTAAKSQSARDEYAATGMGRATDHAVTQVWLELEETPSHSVNVRYEYRPQLVRLGIVPGASVNDPLDRRERAEGFEPGFAPRPPRKK